MDLSALLSTDGGMLAAAVFGITFAFRATLAKVASKEILEKTWVKIVSTVLPLLIGPLVGLALLHSVEAWQARVMLGLVASTVVMVGRDFLKLGGKAVSHE